MIRGILSRSPLGWGEAAALLAGALLPLAYAPFGFYPLAWLSLAAFFLLLQDLPARRALLRGWCYGIGLFGVGVSWVYVSIHYYGNAGVLASAAAAFAMVLALALYPALLAWGVNRFGPRRGAPRYLLLLPAAWVLAEWLRGWVFTGFPWLNLGYSQIETPLAGFAPLLGVYGVSWLAALLAGLLALAWREPRRSRGAGWLALAGLLLVIGLPVERIEWTRADGAPVQASLLQGNIAQDMKWLPEVQMSTVERYAELTRDSRDSQLIIWPETAIPAFYHQVEEDLLPQLQAAAERWDVDLLIGIPLLDRERWEYFNAVMSVGEQHRFYHKQHLVPFGEYMPWRPLLERFLTAIDLAMADFSRGAPDQPLLQAAGHAVGTSICYEVAFGEEIIRALPDAALLVNVSNDGWFGDSLAPHQHLEIARMRARETGRYLLRATNTGISAIIDERGRVVQRSPQFEVAVLTGPVQPRTGATPYVMWGNWPVVSGALLVLALVVLWRRRVSS
ncbi:MAG: apolipoprotein N-acyltransferase [Gammaproteobacteria bacterium]|nr:apolipoprotein N-acyltransferase [Gammaproteobacteria bacterium]